MRRFVFIAFLLISSGSLWAQTSVDPETVLARAKNRILADLDRIPRYTCVKNITRNRYAPPGQWHKPVSCTEARSAHDKQSGRPVLESWDRLRLDVAVDEHGEIYAWAGAPKFDENVLRQIEANGAMGTGDFGPFMGAILHHATIKFSGEHTIRGRQVFEYSYDVAQDVSRYIVRAIGDKEFFTAYSGTFLLDRDEPDLVELTVRTQDLPPEAGACQVVNEVEYDRIRIHETDTLVPRESRLIAVGDQGQEMQNLATYDNCREYGSKTVIRFDAPEAVQPGDRRTQAAPVAFPPGLSFEWRIVSVIDSATVAAGDRIEAVLRSPIRDDKGKLLAPPGTPIHGRAIYFGKSGNWFSLIVSFESIDVNGSTVPFVASLASDRPSRIHLHLAKADELFSFPASVSFTGSHPPPSQLESSGRTALPHDSKKPLIEKGPGVN